MGWGEDARKAIAKAGKAGIDISDFKAYDGFLKSLEEASKLFDQISPAFKSVEKFLIDPDPAAYRDLKIFFAKRKEFIDLSEDCMKKAWAFINISNGLEINYKKEKNKELAELSGEIGRGVRSAIPIFAPKGHNALFKNLASEAIKNRQKQHKAELDALESFIDDGTYTKV